MGVREAGDSHVFGVFSNAVNELHGLQLLYADLVDGRE